MASFEEEGSARTFIRLPCECLAAPDHGIRDDGLIGIDGDVLHRDLLLTFSAVAVEGLGKQRYGSGGLVGERKVSRTKPRSSGLEAMLADKGRARRRWRQAFGHRACLRRDRGDQCRSVPSERRPIVQWSLP